MEPGLESEIQSNASYQKWNDGKFSHCYFLLLTIIEMKNTQGKNIPNRIQGYFRSKTQQTGLF